MKKKILGHFKTAHFKKRQKEREQRDKMIKDAMLFGEIRERDGSLVYSYKDIEVVADADGGLLLTIIKKEESPPKARLLSKEEATKIREALLERTNKEKERVPEDRPPSKAEEKKPEEEVEIDLESYLSGSKRPKGQ